MITRCILKGNRNGLLAAEGASPILDNCRCVMLISRLRLCNAMLYLIVLGIFILGAKIH